MRRSALVITDMLNAYEHEDAERLAASVREQLPAITELIGRARDDDETLVVYVNDNYQDWTAGREELTQRALAGRHPDLVEPVAPREPVPFIPKGRHSAFYQTALDHLLRTQEVDRVVLAGQVTEQCVLYTALDAYLRGYDLAVPRDAVAHIYPDLAQSALAMMERNMHAELTPVAAGRVFG